MALNTRTLSRFLDPDTEAIQQPRRKRKRPEPCDYEYYECARKQLSEFNESLLRRPLTGVKYEWANLMLDKQEKSDSGLCPGAGGSETDNVDDQIQNPTLRYHLGVHGIEVSCYKQEKKPVLDSNEDRRRTIQSKDCVTTNPSSVSLKDYFDMIYGDVRANDLCPSECLENINIGGSVVDSIIDKIKVDDDGHGYGCREGGVLDHHGHGGYGSEDGECSGHSRSRGSHSQDMEIVGEHSGFVYEHGLDLEVSASVQVGEDYGFEREGSLSLIPNSAFDENKDGNQEMLEAEKLFQNRLSDDDADVDLEQLKDSGTGPMQEPTDELVKPSTSSFDIKKPPLGYWYNSTRTRPLTKSISQNQNLKKRLSTTNLDDLNDDGVLGDDLLTQPLEDSERFKQLVQNAFLRFVKALYEIPAQQNKFTKQGGRTTLLCSVCCSNSKKFTSTYSLLQHAFICRTAGLRVEHLGFHKAVCVLTGRNYEATPNGSWVQQKLSDAEALAMKEDLIIWPPVVFVHNNSVANANPEEQMIVSIEKLKAVIKGMGFDRRMTKVCRGEAANQSIMVVNFRGTLSGLQEAEKLHKHYAENKHGRYEFQQIASRSNCTSDGPQKKNKIECFLYGYLGIIEDLDKLDFMTKKRCVVRSKKEIHAIAGGPS